MIAEENPETHGQSRGHRQVDIPTHESDMYKKMSKHAIIYDIYLSIYSKNDGLGYENECVTLQEQRSYHCEIAFSYTNPLHHLSTSRY